jgi:hypothetical protein
MLELKIPFDTLTNLPSQNMSVTDFIMLELALPSISPQELDLDLYISYSYIIGKIS